jgi:hypothetical protein
MDGLLLTRGERLRIFGEKTGLVAGPSLVFALVLLALGLWVDAVVVAAVAGLTAVSLGPMTRTRLGAAICGVLLVAALVALLLFTAWIASHPAPS